MSYRSSLSHLLSSGKRLVRCFIATTLAFLCITNIAIAESSGRGANITTAREPTSRIDPPLREKPAPGVVSSNNAPADSTLVMHKGAARRLADDNLAANAATGRGIEAAEVAEVAGVAVGQE